MKHLAKVTVLLVFATPGLLAQEKTHKQPTAFGIHFIFNDFQTAMDIRSSSLSTVLRNGGFGKLKNMSQGLALTYSKGLSNHFDFTAMVAGSMLTYPVRGSENEGGQGLLTEADASLRGKMFTDKYWFVPYFQVGAGGFRYKGYWGAFIPVGVGLQISFFNEAYLMINSQYRIAVSESANYHFVHSIGLVGNISND